MRVFQWVLVSYQVFLALELKMVLCLRDSLNPGSSPENAWLSSNEDAMNPGHPGSLRFGAFEFDPVSGELRKHRLQVRLTPLARALLRSLLETPLRVHSRQELQKYLWPEQAFLDFE